MTSSTPVALWLVPAAPWHARFSAVIDELARRFDAVAFEPHITLHVGAVRDVAEASAALAAATASCSPITLACRGTQHSNEHFRTLFVPFADPRVHELRDALCEAIDLRGDYELRPHLSLLYGGGLDAAVRERLAATHRFDGEVVAFDEVVLVQPGSSGDLFDIAQIDTRQRRRLIGRG